MLKNLIKNPLLQISQTNQFTTNVVFFFGRTKSGKRWMKEHVTDHYVKEAIKKGYRSRAAFKLIEIQQKYKIIRPGSKVIDLGSAPGGWTEIAVEYANKQNKRVKSVEKQQDEDEKRAKKNVLAIDRLDMDPVDGAFFYRGDLTEEKTRLFIPEYFDMEQVDICLSDMAPNFSGDLDIDHHNINMLNNICLDISMQNLKPGGTLLMKTLQGAQEKQYFLKYKQYFKEFQRVKPSASRSRSSEIYYLGRGFKMSQQYFINQKLQKKVEEASNDIVSEEEMSIEEQAKIKHMTIQFLKKCIRKGTKLEESQIKEMQQMEFLSDFQDWDQLRKGKIPQNQEQFEGMTEQEKFQEIQQDAKDLLGEGALSYTQKDKDFFKEVEEYEKQLSKVEQREAEEEQQEGFGRGRKKQVDKDEELLLSDDELHPEDQRQSREQLYERFEKFFGNATSQHDYMVQAEEEREADKRIDKDDENSEIEKFMNSDSLDALKDKAQEIEKLMEMEKLREAEKTGDNISTLPMDEILEHGKKVGFTEAQVYAIFEEYEELKDVQERYKTHSLQEFLDLREKKGGYKQNQKKMDDFERLFSTEQFSKYDYFGKNK